MQTKRNDITYKLTTKPSITIVDVGKYIAGLVGLVAIGYFGITNLSAGVDMRNRLVCGQPAQEIRKDMEREWGETYHLTVVGRSLVGALKEPNPNKLEQCFDESGEYINLAWRRV